MFACPATEDFFRLRLDQMIDLRHPLAVLASRMPWQELEARLSHLFMRKARSGVAMPDLDLFGQTPVRATRASNAGRPRVPLRVMMALLYLKHAFNESDEGVVDRWAETPTWQFFSGRAYFEHRRPCDATTLVKFRRLLGEEGVEELLAQTINVAVELGLIKPQDLKRVVVDTTVQPKAVAHPTDSRLLETARTKLVQAAKQAGIALKQTFAKEGKHWTARRAATRTRGSWRACAVPSSASARSWPDCSARSSARPAAWGRPSRALLATPSTRQRVWWRRLPTERPPTGLESSTPGTRRRWSASTRARPAALTSSASRSALSAP
jgi:hypothetical protein